MVEPRPTFDQQAHSMLIRQLNSNADSDKPAFYPNIAQYRKAGIGGNERKSVKLKSTGRGLLGGGRKRKVVRARTQSRMPAARPRRAPARSRPARRMTVAPAAMPMESKKPASGIKGIYDKVLDIAGCGRGSRGSRSRPGAHVQYPLSRNTSRVPISAQLYQGGGLMGSPRGSGLLGGRKRKRSVLSRAPARKGNKWTVFITAAARRKGITLGEAMVDPKIRAEYHRMKNR